MIEVLKELKKGTSRREIKEKLNLSNSLLVQFLSKLVSMGLISEDLKVTTKGDIVLRCEDVIGRYLRFISVVDEYINEYNISDIPEKFVKRFYELSEIKLAERKIDTFKPHKEFVDAILNANEIYGYSTIFFPEYVKTFLELARRGVKIELCVNKRIFRYITDYYYKELIEGISYKNVKLFVSKKDFKFCIVVTDSYFSISFYFKNNLFDYKRDFICETAEGVRWGMDLFNYIKSNSTPVVLNSIYSDKSSKK